MEYTEDNSDRTLEPSEVTRPNIEITPPPLEVTKRTERAISEVMSTKPKALKCHKARPLYSYVYGRLGRGKRIAL